MFLVESEQSTHYIVEYTSFGVVTVKLMKEVIAYKESRKDEVLYQIIKMELVIFEGLLEL